MSVHLETVAMVNPHAFATLHSPHALAEVMQRLALFPGVWIQTRAEHPAYLFYVITVTDDVDAFPTTESETP